MLRMYYTIFFIFYQAWLVKQTKSISVHKIIPFLVRDKMDFCEFVNSNFTRNRLLIQDTTHFIKTKALPPIKQVIHSDWIYFNTFLRCCRIYFHPMLHSFFIKSYNLFLFMLTSHFFSFTAFVSLLSRLDIGQSGCQSLLVSRCLTVFVIYPVSVYRKGLT